MPKLLSVNVSLPKNVEHKGKIVSTGIFKEPVVGRVKVKALNIEGDGQADLIGHGGEFRAVYVYSFHNYSEWQQELGRDDFEMGQFGENFTVDNLSDQNVFIGDRYKIGSALFEVTQPRVPCYKLAIKMKEEAFYSRILKSGRLGFYFRVLEEGEVGAGDEILKVHDGPLRMTVDEVNRLMYFDKNNLGRMEVALKIKALSPGWMHVFDKRLSEAHLSPVKDNYSALVVTKKVPESNTITSFYLESGQGSLLESFLPGQFLPIKLEIPGQYQDVIRTYTISNSPMHDFYRLTIKRELAPANLPSAYPGLSSNYFHDQVQVGSRILARPPRGKFYLNTRSTRPVVLLSAGVGLTPMISMLETLVLADSKRAIWFIHGARNQNEHAMGDHVRALAEGRPNIGFFFKYSQPSPEDQLGTDYHEPGRVDMDLLRRLLPDKEADFYLCGPPLFMKSLFSGLVAWGVPETQVNYEFFGPASILGDRSTVAKGKRLAETTECCEQDEVVFSKSGVKTSWNPSFESILDLAEAEGLSPDYSCRSGICQTCTTQLELGEVEYFMDPLEEPAAGQVLICCSKPKGNVILNI